MTIFISTNVSNKSSFDATTFVSFNCIGLCSFPCQYWFQHVCMRSFPRRVRCHPIKPLSTVKTIAVFISATKCILLEEQKCSHKEEEKKISRLYVALDISIECSIFCHVSKLCGLNRNYTVWTPYMVGLIGHPNCSHFQSGTTVMKT